MQQNVVTIIANNYLPFAKVLCKSFLANHTKGEFFTVLVDEKSVKLNYNEQHIKLIEISDLNLPQEDYFLRQYSVLELATAVKPYVLRYLFESFNLKSVVYLDPDILVTGSLDNIFRDVLNNSIVLTPHMLAPPPDDGNTPSELNIMQSGAYNLGFLGLRNDRTSDHFLRWWAERLATKCIVDPKNGIFVDQRWIDLVPSYFSNVAILRDHTLNVAYWNLHERSVTSEGDCFFVNKRPLRFFHFSGFDPTDVTKLSKHQTRHGLEPRTALAKLTKKYAKELCAAGFIKTNSVANAYAYLPNGIPIGRTMRYVIRTALEKKIKIPSPVRETDAFCRFLMTPTHLFGESRIAPIIFALKSIRPDVVAAFPDDFVGGTTPSRVLEWVETCTESEEGLSSLFHQYGSTLTKVDVVEHALSCWRRRLDLQREFSNAFASEAGVLRYSKWIDSHGVNEEGFTKGDGDVLVKSSRGALKPLMLYVIDNTLQREFPLIFLERDRRRYMDWLNRDALTRDLVSVSDIAWFDGFVTCAPALVASFVLSFGPWFKSTLVGGSTIFDLRNLRDLLELGDSPELTSDLELLYSTPLSASLWAQSEHYYYFNEALRKRYSEGFVNKKGRRSFIAELVRSVSPAPLAQGATISTNLRASEYATKAREFRDDCLSIRKKFSPDSLSIAERLKAEVSNGFRRIDEDSSIGVNLAGYILSPTGMGESCRAMIRTLGASNIRVAQTSLPSLDLDATVGLDSFANGELFKSHDPSNRTNIIVANGDNLNFVKGWLPFSYWQGRHNIGYWVWETDKLPIEYADTSPLAEIWTPSEYSRRAISSSVNVPVSIVPHAIDFDEIDRAREVRDLYGLQKKKLVIGFFFDCKSVIERKNPSAVISALRRAFGTKSRDIVLVLKISSPEYARDEIAKLQSAASDMNVVWVFDKLARHEVLNLMLSLDVYISLHRSEGFGLTIAEAMAMGKPVIASGYSGNLDFMTQQTSSLVETDVIQTERKYGPYPKGTYWGDPKIEHAAHLLNSMLDIDRRIEIGQRGMSYIRKVLDSKEIGKTVRKMLSQVRR